MADIIPKQNVQSKQQQILDAAIVCVKRWGIERITINDVADEAGAARSTVYTYYKSKNEIVRAALLHSGYQFGEKLFEHILSFDTAEERMIEAVVYSLRILPDEPSLALISDSTFSEMLREHTLTTPEGVDIGTALVGAIMQDDSYEREELQELSEAAIRFMLSLVTMESPVARDEEDLKGYVARRLLPVLSLPVPDKYDIFRRNQKN